jgi:hypothetical protein
MKALLGASARPAAPFGGRISDLGGLRPDFKAVSGMGMRRGTPGKMNGI